MENLHLIIDFDSTFITREALDLLAEISLAKNPQKEKIVNEIADITRQGMEGVIDFPTSLKNRLKLFSPTKKDLKSLTEKLQNSITPSILKNKEFFIKYTEHIYIISGGFAEYIYPVVKDFGIQKDHILANEFLFEKDRVTGFNEKNLLAQKDGKTHAVKALNLKGNVYVVGDGYTDFEIRQNAMAEKFFAFTENIRRESVVIHADQEVKNFDEVIQYFFPAPSFSYPKHKINVLLLENIDPEAVNHFEQEGYHIENLKTALLENELIKKIKDVSILGIRSKTEVTKKVFTAANRLHAVGAFCIGTNQIDVAAAAESGIVVFNAPFSNTRSVVELVIGEIIMVSRFTFDKSTKLHEGIWDKSAAGSHEVRGKNLGIIGYGNIGTQLSVIAEALGMNVYFYDTAEKLALGNAKKCSSLEELLQVSDIVTVHVDGRVRNKNLIGVREFDLMKKGTVFLNLSRGFIVDLEALSIYIKNGKIRGAAVDVFPEEPKNNEEKFVSKLQNLPNVILTPHVGGSTEEAQKDIGKFVSQKLIEFINSGNTMLSVNFPSLQLPEFSGSHRLIHMHKNVPGVLSQINSIFAKHSVNVVGQYLGTNDAVGYVITDINRIYNDEVIDDLKKIPETIRLRVLY